MGKHTDSFIYPNEHSLLKHNNYCIFTLVTCINQKQKLELP